MNFVHEPIEYHPNNLSESHRQKVLDVLEIRKQNTDKKFYLWKVYNEMSNILKEPLLYHQKKLYNMLMRYDKQRNLESRNIFPELYSEVLN